MNIAELAGEEQVLQSALLSGLEGLLQEILEAAECRKYSADSVVLKEGYRANKLVLGASLAINFSQTCHTAPHAVLVLSQSPYSSECRPSEPLRSPEPVNSRKEF